MRKFYTKPESEMMYFRMAAEVITTSEPTKDLYNDNENTDYFKD